MADATQQPSISCGTHLFHAGERVVQPTHKLVLKATLSTGAVATEPKRRQQASNHLVPRWPVCNIIFITFKVSSEGINELIKIYGLYTTFQSRAFDPSPKERTPFCFRSKVSVYKHNS